MIRRIRIAAIDGAIVASIPGRSQVVVIPAATPQSNLDRFAQSIRRISSLGVDIACLPEAFTRIGTTVGIQDLAEAVPGPTTDRFAELARAHGIAVVCPLYERRAGEIFNTAVIIDRDGQICGRYDKVHPTRDELDASVRPGETPAPLLELERIKIGVQTCFDANWADEWLGLKRQGMQLAIFPSEFSGGRLVESLAVALAVPIVVATACRESRIHDRLGRIVAHQTPYYDHAIADLLIDQPLFHLDGNWENVDAIRRHHPDVSIEVLGGEGRWTMNGVPAELDSIIAKYGLVDIDAYLASSITKVVQAGS